jgi:hypothetical protein
MWWNEGIRIYKWGGGKGFGNTATKGFGNTSHGTK